MTEKITPGILLATVALGVYLAMILHDLTVWAFVMVLPK